MEDGDDDFGELYADIEFQANSSINNSQSSHLYISKVNQPQQQSYCGNEAVKVDEKRDRDLEMRNGGSSEVGVKSESDDDDDDDDDDDFDVFVNDEDIGVKNGGGDAKRCSEEMVENVDGEFVEGSLIGKNQMGVDVDRVDRSGGGGSGSKSGNGDGCGGERGNVGKIGSNSQCKYARRNGSGFVGSQRAMSSWKTEREDVWCGQPKMSGFPSLSGNGSSFWLPWYRTILDVDIDTIEQKSWTYPGADITDYFNYSFDEESWKNYCHTLDQLRQQTLSQTRNQINESLRFKLKTDAGAIKELQSGGFFDAESIQFEQMGQAIHVEDNNIERQPSTDARRPRMRDSDVIEINVQDPEKPSIPGNEELCNTRESQLNLSEIRCDPGNSEAKGDRSNGSKSYEMRKRSMEEAFRSSSLSCDSKRSDESGAVSSHVLQHSDDREKDQKYELDIEPSEKGDSSSGRNLRVIRNVNCSMKDVDNSIGTEETNPSVAGIDLSFDDHGLTTRSTSYSDTCSEASPDCSGYSKRNRESKKDKTQVANTDYQSSRRNRDDKNGNGNGCKYSSRGRNSIKENLKYDGRKVGRRVGLKGNYDFDHSKVNHHHRSEERGRSTSDDEYWSEKRENEYSPGCYDKRFVEDRLQVECVRDFDRRGQSVARDGVDMYFQREWDEEFSSDGRLQRMRGENVKKDWRVDERECLIRDEKPHFRNENFMSKFSSSRDINSFKQQREFDDVDFDKRNRHQEPLRYRDDDPMRDRFVRTNPLDDRKGEHFFDLDMKHERWSWRSKRELGTFGEGEEIFERSMKMDYPQYTIDDDYDNDEYRNTLYRDDTKKAELYQRHERRNYSISRKKSSTSRHVYYNRVSYNQQGGPRYCDKDDYFGKGRNVVQSNGVSWNEDELFDEFSDYYDYHGGTMLNSFKGVPSHKWNGVKRGFVRGGGMIMNEQIMRGRSGIVGCDKPYSKMSRVSNIEENEPWRRNSLELHHTVGERKSTRNFPKPGILPNNDADKRFKALPDKTLEKKTRHIESSSEILPSKNRTNTYDLEEGQIPMEEPGFGHSAQKNTIKGRTGRSEMSQNDSLVYDENQILETMAKMEKRRERFKEPVLVKKETDPGHNPEEGKLVEVMDSKGQRPARKRKWG